MSLSKWMAAPASPESIPAIDALTVFTDGPVTGELLRDERKAPKGTRLEGHLWTTGDHIYGRYRRAVLPDGRSVPICFELGNFDVGLDKEEGSKPGHAVGVKQANGLPVEQWH